jgi:hypothetical protein
MNKLKILGTLILVLCCSTILVGQTSFSIPDSSLTVGESILIPVTIDIDTTENIFGIHMNITYDTTIVEFLGTVRMGSISENITTASNEKNGRVLISMAAINPIKESGDLIYLEFTALNVGNSALSIVEYRINENSIIYSDERGSVKVFDENGNQPPFIVQIPDTLSFYSNDTLEVFIDESLFTDAEDNFTDLKISFTIDPLVVIPIYSADTGLLTITTLDYSGIATLNIIVEDLDGGVLEFDIILDIEVKVSNKEENDLPTKFVLHQNYPNPFNPGTNISYQLSKSGNVLLEVYSLNGQLISTLVNSFQTAGNYTIYFNASNLSSGVYLYKISGNDFISVKKMLLLK